MPQLLIAAVNSAAARIDCLSSLAVTISETLDQESVNPFEAARRASNLARIAFEELKAIEHALVAAEEAATARFARAEPPDVTEAA